MLLLNNDIEKILLGSLIALLSSTIIEVFKIRLSKKQQVNFFKSTLLEDLSEIYELIHDMRETHTRTQIIDNDYLIEMFEIEKKFSSSRHDNLYLIRKESLRKEVKTLFKTLNSKIQDSTNKVSTLGEIDAGHNQIITDFNAIETTLKNLIIEINKYKWCVLLIIW